MQKTHPYKRCLRAAAFTLAAMLPVSGMAAGYKTVSGGALNLRQNPSLEASVLRQFPNGTWLHMLSEEGEWSKVEADGLTGYVMSKYLSDSSAQSTMYVRTNTGRGLNLRSAPSMEGSIITSFKPGTAVTVLARGNAWHKVSVDGNVGYMSAKYLTAASSSAKTAVVSNPGENQVLLLRETASTDARVLGYYANGTQVTIHGEEGDFYKVSVAGKSGYMMKKFLKLSSSVLPQTPFKAKLINPNGNSIVNFRKAPGLDAAIIRTYQTGTVITVLEEGETWCKAEIDGVVGYVSRYFFKPAE